MLLDSLADGRGAATLIIQPGTSVYFSGSTRLNIAGTLVAEGTDLAHIRFTRRPGVTTNWNGIRITCANDNRLAYIDEAFAGSNANQNIVVSAGRVSVDHGAWFNTTFQIMNITNSSFKLTNSALPALSVEAVHVLTIPTTATALIQGNTFGKASGFNDVMDITGGQRPDTIVQILDNVFNGSDDDILDLDGTDAHIEGNIFRGAHLTNPTNSDTSSAISGGKDESGVNSGHYVIVRNWFYDLDHAVLAKEGNTALLVNNTIFNMRVSAVNFDEPTRAGIVPGKGAQLYGNIIWNVPIVLENVNSDGTTTELVTDRNIAPTLLVGDGNSTADPLFVNSAAITDPRVDLALMAGSPAIGAGPNGRDLGADFPAGASISGVPASPTVSTSATLTIGGPDIYAYKYRLDNGAWSAEIPTVNPGLIGAVIPSLQLSSLAAGSHTVFVVAKNSAGVWQADANATVSQSWTISTIPPTVAHRYVFYNQSAFDGNDPAAGAADDGAIATDKSALLPGNAATLSNYTSYSRGLNGVMLDLNNYAGTPSAADFTFKVGNDSNTVVWASAPGPSNVTARSLGGPSNTSRITITWPNAAIHGQWLQVTANTSLGLAQPDVFYFGNAIGESGNSAADAKVDANDEIAARNNLHTFLNSALIDAQQDFNRDGYVNAADQIVARGNVNAAGAELKLLTFASFSLVAEMTGQSDVAATLVASANGSASPKLAVGSQPNTEGQSTRESDAAKPIVADSFNLAAGNHATRLAADSTRVRAMHDACHATDDLLFDLLGD